MHSTRGTGPDDAVVRCPPPRHVVRSYPAGVIAMNTADLAARLPQLHAQLTRREWLQIAAASGGALATGLALRSAAAQDAPVAGGTWTMALAGNPTAYPIT